MFVSSSPSRYALPRLALAASVIVLASFSLSAKAQSQPYSSSTAYQAFLDEDLSGSMPAAAPGPQYGQSSGPMHNEYHGRFSRIAVEAGGGFTAPLGNSQADITYGWNFTGGLGYKLSRRFGVMAEYQFNHNKIPGAALSAVGEPDGNIHIWSLTLDPIWNYKTSGSWGGYITGGGGFYRKLTSFTEPVIETQFFCDFFSCFPVQVQQNVVVSHFSSNQGGLNLGTGITFGNWNGAKFYSEARYEWLDTPGRGTQIIPVTFGLRW
jgi:hypothetical protein